MRRILIACMVLTPALSLTACGGTAKPQRAMRHLNYPICSPTPGSGHMGICAPRQLGLAKNVKLPANQGLICDEYEGNTIYSWSIASKHIVGCILKAYEVNYREDAKFAQNWNSLASLHVWHAAYLFDRAGDCSTIAHTYVNIVNSVGGFNKPYVGPPIIDAEVPNAVQNVACLVTTLEFLTHRQVVIYTAPGTWSGGGHGDALQWAAGYGNYSHSPCIWTCASIAWQYTDGVYGPYPHQIPGIQPGDISVSYGFQNLVYKQPAPAKIYCFGKKGHPANQSKFCQHLRVEVKHWINAEHSSTSIYTRRGCITLAQRIVWFSNKIKTDPKSSKTAHRKGALASSRSKSRKENCDLFGSRAKYFHNKSQQALSTY